MHLSIRTKLLGGFALVSILFVGALVLTAVAAAKHDTATRRLTNELYPARASAAGIPAAVRAADDDGAWMILTPDSGQQAEMLATYRVQTERVATAVADARTRAFNDAQRDALAQFDTFWSGADGYLAGNEVAFGLKQAGRDEEARALYVSIPFVPSLDAAQTYINEVDAEIERVQTAADAAEAQAQRITIAMGVLATVLAAGTGFWISRGVSRGVTQMKRAAEGIAQGDLVQDIHVTSKDEIGDMAASFERMIDFLSRAIGGVRETAEGLEAQKTQLSTVAAEAEEATEAVAKGADEVARAASEVATTTTQLADGATQQSAGVQNVNRSVDELTNAIGQVAAGAAEQTTSITEVTTASEQVAQSAREVATRAEEAEAEAQNAAGIAQEGAVSVNRTVNGIERIQAALATASEQVASLGSRSEEIGKIVAVIDDIAAQTNLLALNAAIEAARAGDQGRGFAVVADEVRQLAERVANATKEIASLIEGVQSGVDSTVAAMQQGTQEMSAGTAAAAEAGEALERVLGASRQVSSQISQITRAAASMREAGEKMARRIEDIRGVVEQNSSATTEMEATASSVADSVSAIAAVAEQNSAATEQVSASTEQMAASAEEMTASATTLRRQVSDVAAASLELGKMATNLTEQVASFKLRDATTETPPPLTREFRTASGLRVARYGWDDRHDQAEAA
ncbi:MAG: methyl-accepting chemotaxis protein [Dehalococcoidia bacterium]